MTANNPLIRNTEVIVGPLTDFEGGGDLNNGLRVFSDGSRENLRVSFDIKKTLQALPNEGVVKIYNLPRSSRERVRGGLSRVRVSTGYENTGISVIGGGGILDAYHDNQKGTYVTEVAFFDGLGGTIRGISNVTFRGRVNVSEVVRTLAEDMPGVSVGRIDVDGSLGRGGYTISDRSAEALDELAAQFGFSWSIQNGVFQALQDRRVFGRIFTISNENRNLIKATPITVDAASTRVQTGVEIVAIIDSRVNPGDQIDLTSLSNPQINGRYKVHVIQYIGDTGDETYQMKIQSFRFQ